MKPHQVPTVPLQPLKTISPSAFSALNACPLRAVWAAHSPPLLPRSAKTRLGTVVHHLWEAAASGKITDEAAFDKAWRVEIDAQETDMLRDWKEAHLVPLNLSVPDLEVRRLRCRRQLTGWRSGTGRTTYRAEQMVTDATGTVKGRIDVVSVDANGAHLIDLKTGEVVDAAGAIKEEYLTQLKLYAALYHETNGNWPASLALRTADGREWTLNWTPAECCALLLEAVEIHARINTAIEQGPQGETLAKPDPVACQYCPFRPACSYYWQRRQNAPGKEWPMDARGRVENLTRLGNGRWKLCLVNELETVHIRGLSPTRQTFLRENLAEVAFYSLRCESTGQYTEGSLTTGYCGDTTKGGYK